MNSLIIISGMISFLSLIAQASTVYGKIFRIEYNNGYKYQISLTETQITWEGIEGPDYGRRETNQYEIAQVGPETKFLKWVEMDGTFVSLVLNSKTESAFSAGVLNGKDWFYQGTYQEVDSMSSNCSDSSYRIAFKGKEGILESRVLSEWQITDEIQCFPKQGAYLPEHGFEWVANCQSYQESYYVEIIRKQIDSKVHAKLYRRLANPKYSNFLGTLKCQSFIGP